MSNLFPGQFIPLGFASISISHTAASGLTVPDGARMALIQGLTSPVQWRDDGVAPTAVDGGGMFMDHNLEPMTIIGNLRTIKFISTLNAGSTLLVSFYG